MGIRQIGSWCSTVPLSLLPLLLEQADESDTWLSELTRLPAFRRPMNVSWGK
jgi:hypothetical protein